MRVKMDKVDALMRVVKDWDKMDRELLERDQKILLEHAQQCEGMGYGYISVINKEDFMTGHFTDIAMDSKMYKHVRRIGVINGLWR